MDVRKVKDEEMHEELAVVSMKRKHRALMLKISELEIQAKALAEAEKELKEKLKTAMEEYGIKSFTISEGLGDKAVTFTYVGETTSCSIDTAKLKEEYPEVAAACMKESVRKSYVSAKVK